MYREENSLWGFVETAAAACDDVVAANNAATAGKNASADVVVVAAPDRQLSLRASRVSPCDARAGAAAASCAGGEAPSLIVSIASVKDAAAGFFVYIATIALALSLSVRLVPTALTVIGGALAFAVGFALRDLVASFIAGIMFDRPFQVGDRVAYGGEYGDIITIGLRSVRMNTLDHNIIIIPTTISSPTSLPAATTANSRYRHGPGRAPRRRHHPRSLPHQPVCLLAPPIPILAKQVILHDYVAFHLKARPYVFDFVSGVSGFPRCSCATPTSLVVSAHESRRLHRLYRYPRRWSAVRRTG